MDAAIALSHAIGIKPAREAPSNVGWVEAIAEPIGKGAKIPRK